jgi:heavy metal sensor kinase
MSAPSVAPAPPTHWRIRAGAALREFTRSIRFRLTLWTVAILVVILLAFSAFIYSRTASDLQTQAVNQLQAQAQQASVLLNAQFRGEAEEQDGQPSLPEGLALGDAQSLTLLSIDGVTLQQTGMVDQALATRLVQSWQAAGAPVQSLTATVSTGQGILGVGRQVYLLTPLVHERRWIGLLLISRPLDADGQLPRLAISLALGSLATLGIALAGGYWLAGRAMAPVRTITRAARGISESDLHRRLRLGTHDELGELADTFDAMLDRLQAAFDRQRQFTADASHELRTPLTIMGLEAEQALAHPRTPAEYAHTLQTIRSENEFMARLVNDLLTLARMDAGQTRLRHEMVDLSDVALEVAERLTPLARRAGVILDLGEVPAATVMGDPLYLRQMLANLVENAIKYAGEAGKRVRIECGLRTEASHAWAWASVEDDGPGIPPEHLEHLFDRFYRVDAARTRRSTEGEAPGAGPDGSGLGLSIVQWIARAHQGEVSVESQPGHGTRFEVRLPAAG